MRRRPSEEQRQRRLNTIAGAAFAVGGSLFALGAAVAQIGAQNPRTAVCIYFAGGLFFNTGGYVTVLQVINSGSDRWRWWSWEPDRVEWLSAAVLFGGTLVFGVNLLDSFLQGLTAKQVNRLIWAPDMVGCAMFLVSGHLALAQLRRDRSGVRPLDWWIAGLNQARLLPVPDLGAGGVHRPGDLERGERGPRQLGHVRRRALLCRRRGAAAVRAPGGPYTGCALIDKAERQITRIG